MNRREFLTSAGAVAAASTLGFEPSASAASAAGATIDSATRDLFPWAENETFINSAAYHPISIRSAEAAKEYIDYRLESPPADVDDVGAAGRGTGGAKQIAIKEQFARLINAKPTEIAFAQSTADGENIVVAGMELGRSGGNVVVDELHYPGSIYMYKRLEEHGLDVRMIRQHDGAIDIEDVEQAVDGNTKLVSLSFVASSNGYVHDLESVCRVAHAQGAYVYADVIQGVGAVPLDVQATGLDFCSCSSYKWLMGSRGFGFLYVKESLQDSVVKPTRFGHRQFTRFDVNDGTWDLEPGAYRYETGNVSNVGAACVHESLKFILDVGVENIRAHVKPLTDRLQEELPAMGYPRRTPLGNDGPTVTFGLKDSTSTAEQLKKANIAVTVRRDAIRVSPSVFNNQEDIDKLLGALSEA